VTDELRQRDGDQPLPIVNHLPFIHDLVIEDLERLRDSATDGHDTINNVIDDVRGRKDLGTKRYGTALQPFNGRDVRRDANEELLDTAAYMRQQVYELGLLPDDVKDQFHPRVVMYKTILAMLTLSRKLLDTGVDGI